MMKFFICFLINKTIGNHDYLHKEEELSEGYILFSSEYSSGNVKLFVLVRTTKLMIDKVANDVLFCAMNLLLLPFYA